MEFRILGPLELRDATGTAPLPRRRERVLLAALLLRPGEVVSIDRLIGAIWGESPPRTAAGSLQNAVSELRKTLGPEVIVTRSPGYVLVVEPAAIDAVRFEDAVRGAAHLAPAERAEALAGALALWRGPALADLADEDFVRHEAARLDELRLAATEERLAADLELGRGADLVAELEAHVAANPLRERLRGQLMVALYRSGRQAEALEAYQAARRALVDGLGIDPSPALQELERRVLRQDPDLLAIEKPAEAATPRGAGTASRRTVTVLAVAIDDVAATDPECLRARVERFLAVVREAVTRHGGTLDRFLGAEAVAVFGFPSAHEDDALRAARAAAELREALKVEGDAVRVGLATGEALTGSLDSPVIGDVVVVAGSLRDAAARDGILAAESTYSLIRDAVSVGDSVTAGARQLVAHPLVAVQGARGRARQVDTPFVGREANLDALRDVLGRATAERRCVAVTVIGDAGIGKTRLADELATSLVSGQALTSRCAPYGEGTTFDPLLELVRQAAGEATEEAIATLLPSDEGGRLAARHIATLVDPSAEAVSRGDVFSSVRRLLESLARDDPLVVILDDVHWAEPVLLDLAEYLCERVNAPVALYCMARPEIFDTRPDWAGAASGIALLHLERLDDTEAGSLLDGLGADGLEERTRRAILRRGEGNPLHLEQLLAYLAEEGDDVGIDAVPPSIEAVLASRLDLLEPATRETLQRAAVAGRHLTRNIVVALSEPGDEVDAALLQLTRRGLLHPEPGDGLDDAYRFHHALLSDVTYNSLPKTVRSTLHERAAAWLDRDGEGPDDLVGWHLERAYRYRVELRPDDPDLEALAFAAGTKLSLAGMRLARTADPSTVDLLRRSADLLPDGRERAEVLLELGPWLRTVGDPTGARATLQEALASAEREGASVLEARARIDLSWGEAAQKTERSMGSLRDEILGYLPTLQDAGDDRGLMRAWQLLGTVYLYDEQMGLLGEATRNAVLHAQRAGWVPLRPVSSMANALLYGSKPVPAALAEVERLMVEFSDNQHVWAHLAATVAVLEAMTGDSRETEKLMSLSREMLIDVDDRLGVTFMWTPHQLRILRLDGRRAEAMRLLAGWRATLFDLGDDAYLSTALVELADLRVDDPSNEVDDLIEEARERSTVDDRLVQSLLLSVSAKRLAITGHAERAVDLANEACSVLEASDALCDRARVELDRARVLDLVGDPTGSSAALIVARGLLEEKGNARALACVDSEGVHALT